MSKQTTIQFRSIQVKSLEADKENGLITNVVIAQVGEAKGHGVQLDAVFMQQLHQAMLDKGEAGVKVRFGHPSMCFEALGTYLGRFHNPRLSEDGDRVFADLYLDEVAKKAPQGNLYDWTLEMASKNPDAMGNSIVFYEAGPELLGENGEKLTVEYDDDDWGPPIYRTENGERYKGAVSVYARLASLEASDIVESPAATDGMFSAFNQKAFGVQAFQFLDQHPEVFAFVDGNKPLQRWLSSIPQLSNFFTQYKTKQAMSKKPLKFDTTGTTADGVSIKVVHDTDAPAVGNLVMVVAADGTETPAPDGEHAIVDGDLAGQSLTTVDGAISAITETTPGEDTPAETAPDAALESQLLSARATIKSLQKQLAAAKDEIKALKAKVPGAFHTPSPGDADPAGDDVDKYSALPWNQEGAKVNANAKKK